MRRQSVKIVVLTTLASLAAAAPIAVADRNATAVPAGEAVAVADRRAAVRRSSEPARTAVARRPGCTRSTARLQRRLVELHYALGRADGCDGPATRAAIQAFQKAQGLAPDAVAGGATRRALRSPVRPRATSAAPGDRVEVDLARQLLLRVRDGRVTQIYAATTGMPGFATPTGVYRVSTKQPRSWSFEYRVWMHWASYFDSARGLAVHAGAIESVPASHGCVRVPAVFARQIYGAMAPGTTVLVH